MNSISRSLLVLLGTWALVTLVTAQTPPPPTTTPATPPAPRFTTFEGASPELGTAVRNAQAVAEAMRTRNLPMIAQEPVLVTAVSRASAAIVREGQATRADVLAERQAALTRLRLAQTAPERERLILELRTQTGQRLDQQREAARLVRDRLRELRDTTSLTKPPGGS